MSNSKPSLDFAVFHYALPAEKAAVYAAQAIKILRDIQAKQPRLLPYMLAANTVLTLSGVRALDTYITFEKLTATEVEAAMALLSSHGFTLFSMVTEYDKTDEDVYTLVNHAAVKKIPEQYRLKAWIEPREPFTNERLLSWSYLVEYRIFNAMEEGRLPREWLSQRWTAHDIRFGILLGYPGEAIASSCWGDVLNSADKTPELLSAEIAYHSMYDAAWPVYYFMQEVRDNAHIKAHQKLWSDILTAVYESAWHKSVAKVLSA
jgi:hypothetical protein